MSWRFRRRIRILPGFYLNLSKSGLSATVGMKGMSLNVGKNGNYLNTGIPGTGLYNRTKLGDGKGVPQAIPSIPEASDMPESPSESSAIDIKSFSPENLTSEGLFGLKESILNAINVKKELYGEYNKAKSAKNISAFLLVLSYLGIFGFFIKWFKNNYRARESDLLEAGDSYKNFKLNIDFSFDSEIQKEYLEMKRHFDSLSNVDSIWDITTIQQINMVKERSAASSAVTKNRIKFERSSLDFINTNYEALKMQSANGGDFYLYPGFIVCIDQRNGEFALINYEDLNIVHHHQKFIETNPSSDSRVVGHTWKFVNKNGTPDKRFNNNYQIPIVLYYEFAFETNAGVKECYQISNPDTGEAFCKAFKLYRDAMHSLKWNGESRKTDREFNFSGAGG